jgi:hypothetical protein
MKPAQIRKKEDMVLAEKALRENKQTPYDDSFNPWGDDEPLRKDRFKRYYEGIYKRFWNYEPIFRDLCEVYGYNVEKYERKN